MGRELINFFNASTESELKVSRISRGRVLYMVIGLRLLGLRWFFKGIFLSDVGLVVDVDVVFL